MNKLWLSFFLHFGAAKVNERKRTLIDFEVGSARRSASTDIEDISQPAKFSSANAPSLHDVEFQRDVSQAQKAEREQTLRCSRGNG